MRELNEFELDTVSAGVKNLEEGGKSTGGKDSKDPDESVDKLMDMHDKFGY